MEKWEHLWIVFIRVDFTFSKGLKIFIFTGLSWSCSSRSWTLTRGWIHSQKQSVVLTLIRNNLMLKEPFSVPSPDLFPNTGWRISPHCIFTQLRHFWHNFLEVFAIPPHPGKSLNSSSSWVFSLLWRRKTWKTTIRVSKWNFFTERHGDLLVSHQESTGKRVRS